MPINIKLQVDSIESFMLLEGNWCKIISWNVFCSSDWLNIVFFDFFPICISKQQLLSSSSYEHPSYDVEASQSLSVALGRKELTLVFYAANT
jgi:hypothetical protein